MNHLTDERLEKMLNCYAVLDIPRLITELRAERAEHQATRAELDAARDVVKAAREIIGNDTADIHQGEYSPAESYYIVTHQEHNNIEGALERYAVARAGQGEGDE